ncbi:hypothetical protein ACWOBH_11135 [Globicatella sanguinis]
MAKKTELTFELIDELKKLDNSLFNEQQGWEVPEYIIDNLKHKPRYYQNDAIRYFHYTQSTDAFTHRNLRQIMFIMLTQIYYFSA